MAITSKLLGSDIIQYQLGYRKASDIIFFGFDTAMGTHPESCNQYILRASKPKREVQYYFRPKAGAEYKNPYFAKATEGFRNPNKG